jgi:hypothetical protein
VRCARVWTGDVSYCDATQAVRKAIGEKASAVEGEEGEKIIVQGMIQRVVRVERRCVARRSCNSGQQKLDMLEVRSHL